MRTVSLYRPIFNSFYMWEWNASCKHAMLMNGASVEISQQLLTRLFWRDVAVCFSFSNFLCDWPSVDPNLPTAPYDQKDLCVSCRTYTSVESLTTKTAGPIKRPSSLTITSLHNITSSVASCYKSHRLSTSLRPLNCVVLYTTIMRRLKFFHHSWNSPLAVVPWRHHLVMILWLNSQ